MLPTIPLPPIQVGNIYPFPDLATDSVDILINDRLPEAAKAYYSCRQELISVLMQIKDRGSQ